MRRKNNKNVLKEMFETANFSGKTEEIINKTRDDLKSKWMN